MIMRLFSWIPFAFLFSSVTLAEVKLPPLSVLTEPEIVDTFAAFPVQEIGRIKPLENVAEYRLLRFRARRSVWMTESGERDGQPLMDPATGQAIAGDGGDPVKLSGTEWLLMTWFRPDLARTVPLFKVDNSAAIVELGLESHGKKRDQYSFAEIEPARTSLMEKMGEYREMPAKSRSPEQRMIVQLAVNYLDYEMMLAHFDFIRSPVGEDPQGLPEGVKVPVRLSRDLGVFAKALSSGAPPMSMPWFRPFGQAVFGAMMSGNSEQQLRLFPSADTSEEVWDGPGTLLFETIRGESEPTEGQLNWLAAYEDLYLALPDSAGFKEAAKGLLKKIQTSAADRGEAGAVGLELHSLRTDYFFKAQWLFLLGFVALALTWVSPGSRFGKIATGTAWFVLSGATLLSVIGVILRCIIMQRPPITTLYETIIFIGASCALLGLLAELISRRGLGLLIAAVGGMGCMFLAIQFEASEATDTMQTLQAVLITNFWLSTHVPMINLGYAACMVAALISMVYFVKRALGALASGSDEARFMTRVAYGFIGFGLFLSLVGTVLGGIWANYSWGRFWGWDPKENGALMIVLMCLVILHARLGGYIRELGLHCCNLVLGCIVIFSWFGVNQLGVGLHAYGFTDGTWPKIYGFWLSQGVFLAYGITLAIQERNARRSKKQQPPPGGEPSTSAG
jgi:ABC-type transport system involved in cytochrome c biogenesis permease subunit